MAKIVQTAVEIADAEGLTAVSMRRVADELGFTPMSLYRYVPSKDDLLELMQDAAAALPPGVTLADMPGGWREGTRWWARQTLAMFRHHPWFLDIPLSRPPMGPNHVRWMESFLGAYADTGLSHGEMMGVLQLVSTYTLSAGRIELNLTQASSQTGVAPDEWDPIYGQLLAKVIDPAELPMLARTLRSGVFDTEGTDPADDVEFGLEIILDGVEALIRRRQDD
ncbi:TetR/AcrR family transcriptional regulator [Actinobacteria bacterium YIM 96077]|nr:TetR/AcrR family transcriptional regulator [Actinobacteria bacterium YIM 96077]